MNKNSASIKKIGLIAGNNQFPLLFARAAKDQGYTVIAAAIKKDTSWLLPFLVDKTKWFYPGALKSLLEYFKAEGVKEVIMIGKISPSHLVDGKYTPDEEFQHVFDAIKDKKTDTVLSAIGESLKKYGIELMDSTMLLKKYLAPQGTLTSRPPTESELIDIQFGISLAKEMGGIDIGQTVVVKEKAILAIEAMEGTDSCIVRGAKLGNGNAVVVKQSKPKQDMRFDVPVIGPRTIQIMKKNGATCLAIESGKTIVLDIDKTLQIANKSGICIVSA